MGEFLKGHDQALLDIKEKIEKQLKAVMCRTERTWYLDDKDKGIREYPRRIPPYRLPTRVETKEFLRLRRYLSRHEEHLGNILDYWKSCPSVLTFMDSRYKLMTAVRAKLPKALVAQDADLVKLGNQNLKFRMLSRLLFGTRRRRPWKYLWIKPTYCYYEDTFYKSETPAKYLVFSHWRFVPKALALLLSHQVETLLGFHPTKKEPIPLRFARKGDVPSSFHVMEICYPSLALAVEVKPLELAKRALAASGEKTVSYRRLQVEARKDVKRLLENAKVRVAVKSGRVPLWKIMARLEGHLDKRQELNGLIAAAFNNTDVEGEHGKPVSAAYEKHRRKFLDAMHDQAPTAVSKRILNRLTDLALNSPAVCLIRALLSVPLAQLANPLLTHQTASTERSISLVMELCLNELRSYFNKPIVKAVIDRTYPRERHYTRRILSYCRDAHYQAVWDEFCFLLPVATEDRDVKKTVELLRHIIGLSIGTPGINVWRNGKIQKRPTPKRSHFALAFGDDVESSATSSKKTASRKTLVRESFNSPFWPFLLATTSVGQEGLDFHLFCRNVVHWNLPANPVDLEQREGRINRRNCLAIRLGIGKDHPFEKLATNDASNHANIWARAFEAVNEDHANLQRHKSGLYPHWIYQTRTGKQTPMTRMVFSYSLSEDARHYDLLKRSLYLYRLVFGQPRQQGLLRKLQEKLDQIKDPVSREAALQASTRYMINLAPFEKGTALKAARKKAADNLYDASFYSSVVDQARVMLERHTAELAAVRDEIEFLLSVVNRNPRAPACTDEHIQGALATLIYLTNPYDDDYDIHNSIGFRSDIELIQRTCGTIRAALARAADTISLDAHSAITPAVLDLAKE